MKASTLTKKLVSLIALLLVVVMAFSACGGGSETANNDSTNDSADVSNDNATDGDNESSETETSSDNGDSSKKNTTSTKKTTTSAKKTTTSAKKTTTTSKKTTTTTKNNPFDYSTISSDVKSKGVHVLMWRDYTTSEKKQVTDFEKKTGMKVRTTVVDEKNYTTKLISLIAGNDAPDVVKVDTNAFPGIVLKAMQPLNDKYFDLSNSKWYQEYMKSFMVGDKTFAVGINGSWSVDDCSYVTYYSPSLLAECGVTTMPYDLYKAGNWNWDAQKEIITKVATNGKSKGYIGTSLQMVDIPMLSAGVDFADYDYKTGTFTYTAGSDLFNKAWTMVADLNRDKALVAWDLKNVQQGKVGLFSAIAYGLYKEGGWFDNVAGGYQNLQAVPVAGPTQSTAYIPARPKCWGVAKKAKNPAGAAYFLSYFLDPTTIDMSSTFYNKQFETVFGIISSKSAKKRVMIGQGVVDYITAETYRSICSSLSNTTSANLATILNTKKNKITSAITKANKDVARVK